MRTALTSCCLTVVLSLAWAGCGLMRGVADTGRGEPSARASSPASGSAVAQGESLAPGASASASASGHGRRFPVPFVWEASSSDPLARTRGFLREAAEDNASYMKSHPASFFKPLLDSQHPRVTVVTCSDSHVQSHSFDATPEDDLYILRNLGNQISIAPGSVEYGVYQLKTAMVLVVGHTGCGAVKAALGDTSKLNPAIQKEVLAMKLPKPTGRIEDPKVQLDSVIANVNQQVSTAIGMFNNEMEGGDLTIIGAVFDPRNDLKQGAGKLVIVNVNGQTQPERIQAFVKATSASGGPLASRERKRETPRVDAHP